MNKAILLGLALLAAGCGYRSRGTYAYGRVEVPVFGNDSDRRLNEFELTETVVREMQSNGIVVNDTNSPYVLTGRIVRITEPRVVEGRTSQVLVSSESVTIDIRVVERATGEEVVKQRITESAPFATNRGQTAETTRREVFDRVAKRVVQALAAGW